MKRSMLRFILFVLGPILNKAAGTRPAFRAFVKRHDAIVQIQLKDGSIARHFKIVGGKITSTAGMHPNPTVRMIF